MSPFLLYDPESIMTTPKSKKFAHLDFGSSPIVGTSGKAPIPASKRILAALLVSASICVVFVAAIACAEIALGIVGLGDDEYMKVDPVVGTTHLENKWVDFRHEGFSRARISSAGLRDVEHSIAKPAGIKRIAFLGDSKTQALQVNIPETFVRLTEDYLNTDGKRFETINFGMSSHALIQYYVKFLSMVREYKPDVTVVVYHIFDSTENLPKFGIETLPAPTIKLNDKDEMAIDYNFLDAWMDSDGARYLVASEWLRRNSHVFQALSADDFMLRCSSKWYLKIVNALSAPFSNSFSQQLRKMPATASGEFETVRKAVSEETASLDKRVSHDKIWTAQATKDFNPKVVPNANTNPADAYKMLHDAAASDANVAGRLLRMLNLACRESGSKLVVVTLPAPNNSVFYFREIECFKQLAKKEGFTVIDAHSKFTLLAPMEASPMYYKGHFSPAGHRKMAQVLTEGLKPLLK